MRTKDFRAGRAPLFTFESATMRLLGGSGPQTTREQAKDAIKLRRSLVTQYTRHPYAHFLIWLEADESASTPAGWLQLAQYLMRRIGAGDTLWWAFLHESDEELPHMHIAACMVDSRGHAVGGPRMRLGRINVDGSIRIEAAGSRVPESIETIKSKEETMEKEGIEDLEVALKLNVGRWHEDIYQMARHQALANLALDDPASRGRGCGRLNFLVCGVMCEVAVDIYMSHPLYSDITVTLHWESESGFGGVDFRGAMPMQSDYWIALREAVSKLAQNSAKFRHRIEHQIWRNKSVSDV